MQCIYILTTNVKVMWMHTPCVTAGGEFTVYLKFDEYYSEKPPEVFFYTIPFHPNSEFSLIHVFVCVISIMLLTGIVPS